MKWWPVLFVLAVLAVVYLLYRQGFGVSKSIAAVLFVFRPAVRGGRGCGAAGQEKAAAAQAGPAVPRRPGGIGWEQQVLSALEFQKRYGQM